MTDATASWLAERLFAASMQGVVVIALVWLVCRTMRGLPAAVHATLWWLAALKLLLAFTPAPSIELPVLPAALASLVDGAPNAVALAPAGNASSVDASSRFVAGSAASFAPTREVPVATGPERGPGETMAAASSAVAPGWPAMAVCLWLAFVTAHAVRLLREYLTIGRIVRRATAWPDDRSDELTALATTVGLRCAPDVRLSDAIDGPQVSGMWQPVVLMPTSVLGLTDNERTMAVCHELMHIRRRDLVMGWVPAVAERLFFFHPLARLAAREYLVAREAACDAAVVRTLGVAPHKYGQLLVRLGVSASQPVFAAGGAPLSKSSLRRRLEMLQHIESTGRHWRWALVAALLALIPLQLVARTTERQPPPVEELQAAAPADSAPTSPAAPSSSSQESAPVSRKPASSVGAPRPAAPARAETGPQQTRPLFGAPPRGDVEAIVRTLEEISRATRKTAEQEQLHRTIDELVSNFERQVAINQRSVRSAVEMASKGRTALSLQSLPHVTQSLDPETLERHRQLIAVSIGAHLDQLRAQQELLSQHLREIVSQQEQLAGAQRHLAEQAEQLRKLIEARSR